MLSVAMVVKNEIKTLEQTVEAVRSYVDYVAIGVDKASSDGTRQLAEKLADKVITIRLSEELAKKGPVRKSKNGNNDWGFSKARNRVMSVCPKGSWRLTLDGHETVHSPEKMQDLVAEAEAAGCDGVEVPICFEPDADGIPRLSYRQARLLGPAVQYNGPIHNVPVVSKMHVSDGISVEHRKQDQDVKSKVERDVQRADSNINGLRKKVEERPGDSRAWFYLAIAYKESARWLEAIEAYKKYLEISTWKEERWHARVNMGTCYSYLGDRINAREQFVLALEEFPAMAEAYYYLGDLAYKQQRYREAQVWLEKCISMEIPRCKLFVNPRTYQVDRYDLLSMVYNHLGQYDKSIEQAEKALKSTSNPRIKNNVKIWKNHIRGNDVKQG